MPDEADNNFFKQQRDKLDLSPTQMGARVGVSANSVTNWEADVTVPSATIETLAKGYEVSEHRIEREVMALRRRIEAKRAVAAAK